MAEKPRTTFTQDYVLKRIDARTGSIEMRIAALLPEIEKVTSAVAGKARRWAGKVAVELEAAKQVALDVAKQETLPTQDQLGQIRGVRGEITQSYEDWDDRNRRQEVENEITQLRREANLLIHARAYLVESPVEEYSITALQKLGLLDAIKFNLTRVQDRGDS
jgi:hypothetical protein